MMKQKRSILMFSLVAALLALGTLLQPAAQAAAANPSGGTVLAYRLNVRSGPGTGNPVVGSLAQGDRVQILAQQNGWLQIAFTSTATGSAWVSGSYVAVDGAAAAVRIASGPSSSTGSSGLSGTLVFQSSNGGTIYVYTPATKQLRVLTTGFDPALSPDGSTVAFTRVGGDHGLYLINIDGSNERTIYNGSSNLRTPGWSPDGTFIVFSRVTGAWQCRQVGFSCIPDRPGLEGFPLISIDKRGLSRVDYNGNKFRDLAALETAVSPDWGAAGIVYQAQPGIQLTQDQPDATTQSVVSSFDNRYQDPALQPGGNRVILQSKEGSHWEIYSANLDGSGLVPLTRPTNLLANTFPMNVSPAWSPDGKSIVYLSNRDASGSSGNWHLWIMNADGSNQRQLDPGVLGKIQFSYGFNYEHVADWR